MKENEIKLNNTESQKSKIRTRYKGIDPDNIDIIPAIPQKSLYEDTNEKRVAVYARVSTADSHQTSSYELQKNYYVDFVNRNIGWKLIDIYADEGISGTSLNHRDAFNRMLQDCQDGKIDLIVTKSVSRFSRNVIDCIGISRQLARMQPPIGIFFETENIYTLNSNSEMSLSFVATLAQEESHNKSEVMNSSIEMRFKRGIFLTPPLLGYDHDADGNLVINEEEAKTVRLIFFMYLYGYTCTQIAETLTKLVRRTKKNNTVWSPKSILQILQNERHCGDILARKTWTPNYLDHKSKKNKQDRNQYRVNNAHEPIISRDDFIAVQHLISNARYGNKGILPELQVIPDGALKGFVSINPRWAAFHSDDYMAASYSVYSNENKTTFPSSDVEVKSGDFDLRGFEIARSQFFDTAKKICVTLSNSNIQFSMECIRKFDNVIYIEMLVHPHEHLLAIRPCTESTRNAIKWIKLKGDQYTPRNISCAAYIKTLYEIFGWKSDCKYRVRGVHKQKDNESVVLFDMRETEMFIPQNILGASTKYTSGNDILSNNLQPFTAGPKKDIKAYPSSWANTFGNNFYRHSQARELAAFDKKHTWKVNEECQAFNNSLGLNIAATKDIGSNIKRIISDMEQEAPRNDE